MIKRELRGSLLHSILSIAAILVALVLPGCGGGGDSTDTGEDSSASAALRASRMSNEVELAATPESSAVVDVAWSPGAAEPDVAGYRLLRDGKAIAELQDVTAFEDVGLAPSTTYTYRVELIGTSGKVFRRSPEVRVTTLATDPATEVSSVSTEDAEPLAVNSAINVDFTAAMSESDLNAGNFKVETIDGSPIPGSVKVTGNSATFTPATQLAADTSHTATIAAAAKDVAGNPVASTFAATFATAAVADTSSPRIASTFPETGATGVPLNSTAGITFSESMTNSTITTATFRVRRTATGATVAGTVKVSGITASFLPAAALVKNTQYTVTITTGVKDAAGNALASNFVWSFTTGSATDKTAPTVIGTDPPDNKTGIVTNGSVKARFSESMLNSTLTTATFKLARTSGAAVSGTVYATGNYVQFIPSVALAANTDYTATITTGAKDASALPLATNASWTFRTGSTTDTTAPTITSTSPGSGATGIVPGSDISATFSESLRNVTLTPASFKVVPAAGGSEIKGTVAVLGNVVTFAPQVAMAGATQYRATITTAAKDSAGNPLAANYSWTFTTAGTGGGSSSNTASLSWNAVSSSSVSGYRIYYGGTPGSYVQSRGAGLNVGKTSSYTLTGLTRGQRYYFAVTAYDANGQESAYSNEASKVVP